VRRVRGKASRRNGCALYTPPESFHNKKFVFHYIKRENVSLSKEKAVIRTRPSKAGPVGVLTKVLHVLEALDHAPDGLQLRDVVRQTGLNKSTAYRFLAHLENEGYLFRDDVGAYVVGPKLARLGAGTAYQATLRKFSRPVMQRLWALTSETVNLGVLDGTQVLYVDVMESPHSFRLVSQVGQRRPLHCTALGKAMLAFVPLEERETVIASLGLERLAPRTIVSASRLRKEIDRVLRQGYAVDDEEAGLGSRCVSAAIIDRSKRVTGAISVSGPVSRMNRSRMLEFSRAVREGAQEISGKLGYLEPVKARAAGA